MYRVIIITGIPGSGKSSHVRNVYPNAFVCSADHHFMVKGKYMFDATQLGEAHAQCMRRFLDGLARDILTIVVDNTNLSAIEIAPYYLAAQAYGYQVSLYTMQVDPKIAAARNIHGVSAEAIARMAKTLSNREIPPYWNIYQSNLDTNPVVDSIQF